MPRCPRPPPGVLLVLALALLAVAGDARATQVGDGDAFVVTLREDALVCVHTPPPAHPDPACAEFGSPAPSAKKKGPIQVVGSAIVRVPDRAGSVVAIAVLVRAKVPLVAEPETNDDAVEYAREYAGGVEKSLAPAHVRGGAPSAQLWNVHGIPLVRFAFDFDGLPADKRLMEHHVGFAASSSDARYSLVFSSSAADAAVVDAFANDSIASLQLPHRAPTRSQLVSYWVGFLFGIALTVAAGVVLVVVLVRRHRRRSKLAPPAAPAAPPAA